MKAARRETEWAQGGPLPWRGSPRSKAHRGPAARRLSTWLYRNYDSSRLRPHRNGQRTSSRSPFRENKAQLAAEGGERLGEDLQVRREFVCIGFDLQHIATELRAILLPR